MYINNEDFEIWMQKLSKKLSEIGQDLKSLINTKEVFDPENVYLRGFGSFIVKKRAQKTARNISKNTTMIIPAHNIPAFKPSDEFLKMVKQQNA